jgi:hypothetical protein
MDQGQGTGHRTARRARRRWWGTAAAEATDVPRARPGSDDGWFDDWLAGSPAETAGTGHALAAATRSGWVVLAGLNRPGSTHATLEHLAVGPGGIVVVGTLHWGGDVSVVGGTLRHNGYGRTPDVAAVAGAVGSLAALLAPGHRAAVHAVVCVAGHDLDPVAVCGGAVAVGEEQLAAYLTGLPERLAASDVQLVTGYLAAELSGATSPDLLTVDDVFRPATVWDAPGAPPVRPSSVPVADGAPGTAGVEPTRAETAVAPNTGAPGYRPPPNGHAEGRPDQSPDRPAPAAARAPRAGAVGDGLLRTGLVVLGLLTAGNFLLAWLDIAAR